MSNCKEEEEDWSLKYLDRGPQGIFGHSDKLRLQQSLGDLSVVGIASEHKAAQGRYYGASGIQKYTFVQD